jgi:ATP-dependent Lhr-like helicase
MHAASRSRRRNRVEPASIAQFVQFLARWQHVAPGTQLEGRSGLLQVIEQLAGIEVAAGEWESQVLSARVTGYQAHWLDELCLSGEVAWGRLTPRPEASDAAEGARRGAATPSPATPLTLAPREDLGWLLAGVRVGEPAAEPTVGVAADVLAVLRQRGACFRSELPAASGRMASEVDEGLWDLVARGLVTADAFSAVRSLLSARRSRGGPQSRARARHLALARRRTHAGSGTGEGRWAMMPTADEDQESPLAIDELAEAVAWQLLSRWGIVAWELWSRESLRVPWREVIRALRRLEARGVALGGRFVAGLAGEQYAMPEAAQMLGATRRADARYDEVVVAAADPLNLTGTVLGGRRVPAVRNRHVAYRGGVVVEEHASTA